MPDIIITDPEVIKLNYKHPSALISIKIDDMSITQAKVLCALIKHIQYHVHDNLQRATIHIKEIEKHTGFVDLQPMDVYNEMKELMVKRVEYNYLHKDKEHFAAAPILTIVDHATGTSFVSFEVNPHLRPLFLAPKTYAMINLGISSKLKRAKHLRLYLFLKDYINSPQFPKLPIEKFRTIVGIKEYPKIQDFKVKFLDVAVAEINKNTDLTCSCTLHREFSKREYSSISWEVKEKYKIARKFKDYAEKPIEIEAKPEEVVEAKPEPNIEVEPERRSLHLSYKSPNDGLDEDWGD